MKPNLVFTAERRIEQQGRDPIRLAVTMQAWTDREVAEDLNDSQIQAALTKAGQQIGADLFGGSEIAKAEPEECRTCRFWDAGVWDRDPDSNLRNACRRHSPTGFRTDIGGSQPVWPRTISHDYCGDYQRCIPTAEE